MPQSAFSEHIIITQEILAKQGILGQNKEKQDNDKNTLEDLLEEIVGEIRDEYDEDEEELIQKMSEDTYLVEGSMKLDDINDVLGTNLTSEDYDSIGGLIIDCLDRLPEDGEEVTLENGIHLKVQGIDQNRIVKVLMTIPEVPEEHDAGTAEISEDHE